MASGTTGFGSENLETRGCLVGATEALGPSVVAEVVAPEVTVVVVVAVGIWVVAAASGGVPAGAGTMDGSGNLLSEAEEEEVDMICGVMTS